MLQNYRLGHRHIIVNSDISISKCFKRCFNDLSAAHVLIHADDIFYSYSEFACNRCPYTKNVGNIPFIRFDFENINLIYEKLKHEQLESSYSGGTLSWNQGSAKCVTIGIPISYDVKAYKMDYLLDLKSILESLKTYLWNWTAQGNDCGLFNLNVRSPIFFDAKYNQCQVSVLYFAHLAWRCLPFLKVMVVNIRNMIKVSHEEMYPCRDVIGVSSGSISLDGMFKHYCQEFGVGSITYFRSFFELWVARLGYTNLSRMTVLQIYDCFRRFVDYCDIVFEYMKVRMLSELSEILFLNFNILPLELVREVRSYLVPEEVGNDLDEIFESIRKIG